MNADEILKKHEDDNEMHFHEVDRKWIIDAMEEYATLSQDVVSVAVAFARWIGEKRCNDDWFRYDDKVGKWFVYLKGHLSTNELFEMWLATEH